MSALGSPSPLFLASAAADAAAGPIKSVRFNSGDSAHLTRSNPNEGSQRKFTFSFWVKRSKLGANSSVFFAGPSPDSTKGLEVRFDSSDRLYIETFATSSISKKLITNRVFRDPSAWYHIVLAFDTTSSTENNRLIIYVNGEQVSTSDLSTNSQVAQNFDYRYVGESNADHWIGLAKDNSGTKVNYFNGYLTDFYFIDGAQKDETDFGEFDDNGVWQAAAYSGTYGSNGYHLFDFANESTVGHDSSGNEDDWTANNISTTAGAGNDVLFDVPTNGTQSDTGAGGEVSGNYCTWNPLDKETTTLSNGNLDAVVSLGSDHVVRGTFAVSSGKWYWEVTFNSGIYGMIGISNSEKKITEANYSNSEGGLFYYVENGSKYGKLGGNFSGTSYGSGLSAGDIIGVALDMDNGNLKFFKNGTDLGNANSTSLSGFTVAPSLNEGAGANFSTSTNFGQRAFAYSAPSGYKALCTTNLPTPTIADGSDYFDTKLWTGNGSARSITGYEFSPDWVWIKNRSDSYNHVVFDSVRGASYRLRTNLTNAEDTGSGLGVVSAFNSDGFSLDSGSHVNGNSDAYVGWAWDAGSSTVSNTDGSITSSVRANQTAGFSIVSWTGTGSNATIGHSLNSEPYLLIIKNRSNVSDWVVYHNSVGATKALYLQATGGLTTGSTFFQNTAPTSSVFSTGTNNGVSLSGGNFIAYCISPVAGYSAVGSYVGNGNADGPFIYTGFRPVFLFFVATDGTHRVIYDSTRNTYNEVDLQLAANLNSAESNQSRPVDFLSNGFKVRFSSYLNDNNDTIVYYAVAENPFQANGGLAR